VSIFHSSLSPKCRQLSIPFSSLICFFSEPGTKVTKTTTTYTSKNPVSRELIFDSPEQSTINRSIRHTSPSYETRTIESNTSSSKRNVSYNDDGLYGRPRQAPTPSSNQYHITESRTRTISPTPVSHNNSYVTETRTINNEVVPIPKNSNFNEVVRVENTTGPEALRDIHLSNDILPRPKTKVTTTIRTYTYEIPEDGSAPLIQADRDPPKNNALFYKTERNEKSVNYYPNQTSPTGENYPPLTIKEVTPPPQQTTTVYKYTTNTNTSNTSHHSPQPIQTIQPIQPHNNNNGNIPPGGITIYPPNQTTIYKTETVNTTNKQYRSPTPSGGSQYPENYNGYPPPHSHGHPYHPHAGHPHEPSVVVYKQTTTTNTRNVGRPPHEPHLHPFPVDGPVITEVDGNPPKRVEDLMASFGDTSEIHYTNKRVQIAEKPLTPHNHHNLSTTTTKVYSSETDDKSKAVVPSTRNVAGPPVYYPPNHELFTSKEESGAAAYRAQVS
jgi:hypothetical protein